MSRRSTQSAQQRKTLVAESVQNARLKRDILTALFEEPQGLSEFELCTHFLSGSEHEFRLFHVLWNLVAERLVYMRWAPLYYQLTTTQWLKMAAAAQETTVA